MECQDLGSRNHYIAGPPQQIMNTDFAKMGRENGGSLFEL